MQTTRENMTDITTCYDAFVAARIWFPYGICSHVAWGRNIHSRKTCSSVVSAFFTDVFVLRVLEHMLSSVNDEDASMHNGVQGCQQRSKWNLAGASTPERVLAARLEPIVSSTVQPVKLTCALPEL